MGMEMAEDEAEVETLLKQIALAKHKELRLRAEKKRIRDEMGQLQAGALWSREEQTQKQLVEVRRAKEQLEAQKRAEEEKLAKLSDNLREQELKFRRGFQSTPSSFQQAAASLVSTTSTPLQSAVGGSNQHENATPLQKDNAAVSLSMDTRLPRANMPSPLPPPSPRARSPDPVVANKGMNLQENDALQRLIRGINCDEQQKRIERLQVELEKANSRRQEADFPIKIRRRPDNSSDELSGSSEYPEREYPPENHLSSNQASPGIKVNGRPTEAVRRAAAKLINLKPSGEQTHTHPSDPELPPNNNTGSSENAPVVAPWQPTVLSGVPSAAYPSQFVLPGYPHIYSAPVVPPCPFFSPPIGNPYGIGFPSPYLHGCQCPAASPWVPPSASYPFQTGNAPPPEQSSKPALHQQEEDIRRLERELEMQRIANEQRAEAKEFARLQDRLQELQTTISTLTAEDNATMTPVNETAADDKEDSALRSLKRQHLESLAKVRNERDLLEEQEKLEELKEQIQRRRDEKKRELDHEEWVAKQKRELVALRLQRAIQHSVAKPADLQEESAEPYTPDSGFALFWDYAAGLPATVNDVQVTYAVFEGKVIRTPFKVVSSKETKAVGPQHKLCSFLFFRHIKKLPASTDLRVAMEVAAVSQNRAGGPSVPTSLGWTVFEVFKLVNEGELVLASGSFKLPVKQSSMPDPSKTLILPPALNECGDIRLHIRLVHDGRVEEASRLVVNPDLHAARYELPDTGKAQSKPQSRGMMARRPSIQGRRTPVGLSKSLDDQKTTTSSVPAERPSERPPSGRPKQDFLDVDRLRLISSASSRPPSTRPRSNLPTTSDRPRLPPFHEDTDEADEPWIRVDKTAELQRRLLGGSSFQPGDGFNVFIDGGRGFPDSVTISKVTVAAHHADRTQVVAENGSAFASMASDAFDPTFDAYVEYRQSNFNPTLTMVIRVDTLELVSKRPVILGYSVFPVFLDVETRDQPTRPSVPQFILNEGGFQLPLHLQVQSAEANQPLSAKSCDEFPRIPCATLLLRIVKAKLSGDGLAVLSRKDSPSHEWEAKGLLVPAPHYGDQFYDSLRCVPSGIEEKIYSIRHKNRRPKIVSQCLQQLSLSTSEARDTLKVKPAAYLDLTSALRYEPAIGFRIAVDALHNVKAKGGPFFKVLFSVYPPGSLYQTIRLTGDVYFTTTMDWTSAQTSPEFGDGYMTLRDSPTDQLLAVLFVVRSVTRHPKTGAFTSQQYGWTFLPVLAHSRFVNARTAQLPLFQGEVNLSVLKAAVGGLSSLVDDIGNEKVKQLVPVAEDGASLFVRIQDPQLPHLSQPIVNASLSKMAPSRLSAKYTYDSAKIAALKKKTPVSKLLPTNTPENQFEKEMNQAFAQEMGIHHLLF
ncbi:hypothetical protein PF008_g16116 [Phytophthora fragariae]|uniref:Uncharacterized protein n=1 Tax=Phytophthora fragariae TaxID=53985 RepID=A0A6G0RDA8_9STRA|nr:hypothetical protein PF008_g16116 [Phytophthora fragariae]